MAGHAVAQEQDKGTDLTPWVEIVAHPLIGKKLQDSLQLISDQGFALTHASLKNTGNFQVLVFSRSASYPTDEERNSWFQMATKSPLTITVWSCFGEGVSGTQKVWEERIGIIEVRSNKAEAVEIVEAIRELTLLTAQFADGDGTVETFQVPISGDKGTTTNWTNKQTKLQYSLANWAKADSGEAWITYKIKDEQLCGKL